MRKRNSRFNQELNDLKKDVQFVKAVELLQD